MQIKRWMCGQIDFRAQDNYGDPFNEVDITVAFTHESGETLIRPGFWNGKDEFAVRFAPTQTGKWTYKTYCSNRADKGLHNICGEIECVPYDGELEIYKRGFIKISENKRYFTYADGTPFFYLGDTHWLMPSEQLDTSNADGIDSQFKFMVDMRLTQGFTVYQSEPISPPDLNYDDGFGEDDAEVFRENLDKKFAYVAEKGLVHANAQICFAGSIQNPKLNAEYLVRLSKMWAARYGAYPVLWTVAQEVDPDFYCHANADKWIIVGETLYLNDCYKHPLTGHMCNEGRCHPNTTKWGKLYYHSWFGMQPQGVRRDSFEEFWNYSPTKPIINYETGYEHLWNSADGALNAAYRSFFNGAFGYGYGAHGVWNNNISNTRWMNYDGYMRWLDGTLQPGATKLWYFVQFCKMFAWQELIPHFEDSEYWNVPDSACLATLGDTFMVFNFDATDADITLKKLENVQYKYYTFDVNTGELALKGNVTPENNELTLPKKNTHTALVQIITHEDFALPFHIFEKENRTLMRFKGESLLLDTTRENVVWSVNDAEIATVSADGVLTAAGKNGIVTVKAVCGAETAERKFLCVRQNKSVPPEKPEKIEMRVNYKGQAITELKAPWQGGYVTALPEMIPETTWCHAPELLILDADGKKSKILLQSRNYTLNPVCDGECYLKMVLDGVESEPFKLTLSGFGEESVFADANATCDDYHEHYDERCLPQSAINGDCKRFSGWCSEKVCSLKDPAILTITSDQPKTINHIDLYTTDIGYYLRSFDIIIENDTEKKTIASIRDNDGKTQFSYDIDEFAVKKLSVVCYEGDGAGHARVDEVNAFLRK